MHKHLSRVCLVQSVDLILIGSGKIHYILRAPTLVLGLSIIGIDREGRGSFAIGFLDKVRLPSEVSVFIADCLIFGGIGLMHQYHFGSAGQYEMCSTLKNICLTNTLSFVFRRN